MGAVMERCGASKRVARLLCAHQARGIWEWCTSDAATAARLRPASVGWRQSHLEIAQPHKRTPADRAANHAPVELPPRREDMELTATGIRTARDAQRQAGVALTCAPLLGRGARETIHIAAHHKHRTQGHWLGRRGGAVNAHSQRVAPLLAQAVGGCAVVGGQCVAARATPRTVSVHGPNRLSAAACDLDRDLVGRRSGWRAINHMPPAVVRLHRGNTRTAGHRHVAVSSWCAARACCAVPAHACCAVPAHARCAMPAHTSGAVRHLGISRIERGHPTSLVRRRRCVRCPSD